YQNEVIPKLPDDLKSIAWHTDTVRKALAHDPEALEVLDAFVKQRDEAATAGSQLNAALQSRQVDLQAAMNDFTPAPGMPEVQVTVPDDRLIEAAAGASYRQGIVKLRQATVLNPKDLPELAGNMYHELTHSEQDYLIIRSL